METAFSRAVSKHHVSGLTRHITVYAWLPSLCAMRRESPAVLRATAVPSFLLSSPQRKSLHSTENNNGPAACYIPWQRSHQCSRTITAWEVTVNWKPKITLPGCVCYPDSEFCAHLPTASFWGRSSAKWPTIPKLPQRRCPAQVADSEWSTIRGQDWLSGDG